MFGVIRKIADEGTSTPFIARVHLGFLELRDHHLHFGFDGDREQRRREVDQELEPLISSLATVRGSARKIVMTVQGHVAKVQSGELISHQRNAVSVSESIDGDLTDEMGKIYERGYAATQRVQALMRMLGVEMGFLFQKDVAFLAGVENLRTQDHGDLAGYLTAVRTTWSQAFMAARVGFTHTGMRPLACEYKVFPAGNVQVILPTIEGLSIDQYARLTASRLVRASEDLLAYAVAQGLQQPITLTEIPQQNRDPAIARRFATGLHGHGTPAWVLQYEEEDVV